MRGDNMGIVDLNQLAAKQIKQANTLNTIGGILGGVGSLANSINAIYQMSQGRNPLPIGTPVEAIGGTLGGVGKLKQEQGQKNAALGTISKLNVDEPQKQLLGAAVNAGEPGAAFKGAFDVMAAERQAPAKELDALIKIQGAQIAAQDAIRRQEESARGLQKDINEIESQKSDLTSLKDSISQMQTALSNVPAGRIKGNIALGKAALQGDKNIKQYNTLKSLTLSNIARNLGQLKGVLSDTDLAILSSGFPDPTDPVADRKVAFDEYFRVVDKAIGEIERRKSALSPKTTQSIPASMPQGATMKVPGSDGKMHWSDGKNDLGVAE